MSFHPEVMSPAQAGALRRMAAPMTRRSYYLAGGTAVALHFGHRRSVDLDWFTGQPIGDPMVLAENLRAEGVPFVTSRVSRGTLHGAVDGVRVSILEYRYAMLVPPVTWLDVGVELASPDDLACMKLSAIASRGARKDFHDLYVLGTRHRPLSEMIELYRRKFGVTDITPVLYGLAYFDDAEAEPAPALLEDVPWGHVKATMALWLRQLAR